MDIVRASLYFVVLEAVTIMVWFTVAVHFKTIINFMVSAVNIPQVTDVGQNVVTAFNVVFIVLVLVWLGWYIVMVHLITNQTTYGTIAPGQSRRW